MNLKTPAKFLIFDVDETLLASEDIRMEIRNDFLKNDLHAEPMSYFEYRQNCIGKSLLGCIAPWLLSTRPQIKISAYELSKELKRRERLMYKKGAIKTMPFVREFLEVAQAAKLILGVCTGEDQQDIATKLECVGLEGFFHLRHRISRSEAGGQFKPSPAMYLVNWAQYAGSIPRQAVRIFEDNSEGVMSGYLGGFPTIAVPSKWSNDQDFSKATAVALQGFEGLLIEPKKYLGMRI